MPGEPGRAHTLPLLHIQQRHSPSHANLRVRNWQDEQETVEISQCLGSNQHLNSVEGRHLPPSGFHVPPLSPQSWSIDWSSTTHFFPEQLNTVQNGKTHDSSAQIKTSPCLLIDASAVKNTFLSDHSGALWHSQSHPQRL